MSNQDLSQLRNRVAVSPGEAGELYGCSRKHIYELINSGVLASAKLGKLRRIAVAELERVMGQP